MKYVQPGLLQGQIEAPASKSMMQRAVLAAALAQGKSRILSPSYCDDGLAALRAATAFGAKIVSEPGVVHIEGGHAPVSFELDCGESGFCFRMLCALTALFDRTFVLRGSGSLTNRPMEMVIEPLQALGAECDSNGGFLPLQIKGPLKGGDVEVDGSKTSQFLSGLLMALPLCSEDSRIGVRDLKSKPYVAMTIALLKDFGIIVEASADYQRFAIAGRQSYRPTTYSVEGDWSGAAFLLVAAAISGHLQVSNLNMQSLQADRAILAALEKAGVQAQISQDTLAIGKTELRAFDFDAGESPDLFPPLAVLACYSSGQSRIHGTERLRHKESDRASVLVRELSRIGARIEQQGNDLLVEGGPLCGGSIDSHGDHRIAMACSIAALGSKEGVSIQNSECVAKSYPDFFEALEHLKA